MIYKQLLDEAIGTTPPSTVDVDQVVRRQRRAARARPVLAATAAVLVAAGTAAVATQLGDDPVAVPTDSLAGFPEYADGTRVVAATSAPMADRSLALTFTPTTLDLRLFTDCRDHELTDPNLGLDAEISVGDLTTDLPYCPTLDIYQGGWGDEADWWWDSDPDAWTAFWAAVGIEVGEPVTVTVRLTHVVPLATNVEEEPPLPVEGTLALAVGEAVPLEDYPLPPRPDQLAPLPVAVPAPAIELRADSADPNRPVEATMAWDADLASCGEPHGVYPIELVSQTPGTLRVLVNDVEVANHTWWDYRQAGAAARLDGLCEELNDGEQVTVTVEPEHIAGDWRVEINRDNG